MNNDDNEDENDDGYTPGSSAKVLYVQEAKGGIPRIMMRIANVCSKTIARQSKHAILQVSLGVRCLLCPLFVIAYPAKYILLFLV
jgi:hypothetical protein